MKNKFIQLSILLIALLGSCSSTDQKILGKWKQTSLQNSKVESFLTEMKQMIDTLSENNPMLQAGEFTNLEEAKQVLSNQLDTAYLEYDKLKLSGDNSFLEFKKNGEVVLTNIEGESVSNWTIEDGEIVVDDAKQTGTYMINRFKIAALTADSLSLRLVIEGDTIFTSYRKTK